MALPPKRLSRAKKSGRVARQRVDLSEDTSALLNKVCAEFDLPRAEMLRRALRAVSEVGPALSLKDAQTVVLLTKQVRAVGHNLDQLLHAIHAGRAVTLAQSEPIWRELLAIIRRIDEEMNLLTEGYGTKVRLKALLRKRAS